MNAGTEKPGTDALAGAYADGRRAGLALGALAAAGVAFISLLGIEKAILAFVLACLAYRGARPGSAAKRLSIVALVLAGLYTVTFLVVLVIFHQDILELIRLLQKLG